MPRQGAGCVLGLSSEEHKLGEVTGGRDGGSLCVASGYDGGSLNALAPFFLSLHVLCKLYFKV